MTIGSIRALPFVERSPRELLGVVPGRSTIDGDFEGFGWGRFPRLIIESATGTHVLYDVIVLALHSVEEAPASDGDLDLELRIDDEVIIVSLAAFLAAWGPTLPPASAWVLALCNPHEQTLARPACAPGGVPVWYGIGDVDAWQDDDFGLTAQRWIAT